MPGSVQPCALLLIDLDHFKKLNDEFAVILIGVAHSDANVVARDVCERIAGRTGGDTG